VNSIVDHPYCILGVKQDAEFEEIRSAYLKLVREFPPDRYPETFRELHDAYEIVCDPWKQAESILLNVMAEVNLLSVIEDLEKELPRIPTLALLSLGNRNLTTRDSNNPS